MKKNYEAPNAEKMEFNYRDQVVAASACKVVHVNTSPAVGSGCEDYNTQIEHTQII